MQGVMDNHLIVGIHVTKRTKKAGELQKIFTNYGCNIKTRLGLHHVSENYCSPHGLILLELFGDEATCKEMIEQVRQIEGLDVQTMTFSHPE